MALDTLEVQLKDHLVATILRSTMYGEPSFVEGEVTLAVAVLLSIRSKTDFHNAFCRVNELILEITNDVERHGCQAGSLAAETFIPHVNYSHKRLQLKSRELCQIALDFDPLAGDHEPNEGTDHGFV